MRRAMRRRNPSYRAGSKAPRDFIGGLSATVAIAAFALWASSDLQGMPGFSFGAGTAPRMFGVLLLALGAGVTVVGVLTEGPGSPCSMLARTAVCIAGDSGVSHSAFVRWAWSFLRWRVVPDRCARHGPGRNGKKRSSLAPASRHSALCCFRTRLVCRCRCGRRF